jgi:7,8-dihydroneopterin aldolase/epimerase/oxygenase
MQKDGSRPNQRKIKWQLVYQLSTLLTIELQNLIFHAQHGLYEEERKVRNIFEVNLSVSFPEQKTAYESTENTISYVNLYAIVKQNIQNPVFLLEKICQDIILKIKNQYPVVTEIRISIYKLQAPIEGFIGKAGVTMHRMFKD